MLFYSQYCALLRATLLM